MFKKFDASNDVSTSTQVKASVQRGLKSQISNFHPAITEEILDVLLPKKSPLVQYKIGPHLMLYCRQSEGGGGGGGGDEPVFFQHRDGPILPTLKFVHKYPKLEFTKVTVDKGAIPYLLGGANIMCPGLTNPGGEMPPDGVDDEAEAGLEKGDGVVIYAEGKEFPLAVGCMIMSSKDIRSKNKGTGIEVCHFLGDGLWGTDDIQ
jgi:PUA domain protein